MNTATFNETYNESGTPDILNTPPSAHPSEDRIWSRDGTASFVSWSRYSSTFPFLVALKTRNKQGRLYHFCGGSLIRETHVLTAAHCFYFDGKWIQNIGDIEVWWGHGNNNWINSKVDLVTVPSYWNNQKSLHHDVAVLRLSHPFAGARVVQLSHRGSLTVGSEALIVGGWGMVTESWNLILIDKLREGKKSIASPDYCMGQGDSGGPLLQDGYQIGIVFHGLFLDFVCTMMEQGDRRPAPRARAQRTAGERSTDAGHLSEPDSEAAPPEEAPAAPWSSSVRVLPTSQARRVRRGSSHNSGLGASADEQKHLLDWAEHLHEESSSLSKQRDVISNELDARRAEIGNLKAQSAGAGVASHVRLADVNLDVPIADSGALRLALGVAGDDRLGCPRPIQPPQQMRQQPRNRNTVRKHRPATIWTGCRRFKFCVASTQLGGVTRALAQPTGDRRIEVVCNGFLSGTKLAMGFLGGMHFSSTVCVIK
ncbi:Sp7 [Symbiodinium microadriaticum]|nr:Sp7 [Symbiodinium microadriaticum]